MTGRERVSFVLSVSLISTLAIPLRAEAQAGYRCEGEGGVAVDDGAYETASQCDSSNCYYVQKLTPASYPSQLAKACLCFKTTGASTLDYDLVVFDDNGPNGRPGSQIDTLPGTITGLNALPRYEGVDCTALDIDVASGGVYVGARWASSGDFFMCADTSSGTPEAEIWLSSDGGVWADITALSPINALGIRAEFDAEDVTPPPSCVPSDTVLCLGDDRFRVSVTWENFQHQTGSGHAGELTPDSGTFWFFAPTNIEMLVKVVDACTLPGFENFWFFAAATTNVEYDITVTDTGVTPHVTKTYHNTLGVAAAAITDTDAFATCP